MHDNGSISLCYHRVFTQSASSTTKGNATQYDHLIAQPLGRTKAVHNKHWMKLLAYCSSLSSSEAEHPKTHQWVLRCRGLHHFPARWKFTRWLMLPPHQASGVKWSLGNWSWGEGQSVIHTMKSWKVLWGLNISRLLAVWGCWTHDFAQSRQVFYWVGLLVWDHLLNEQPKTLFIHMRKQSRNLAVSLQIQPGISRPWVWSRI